MEPDEQNINKEKKPIRKYDKNLLDEVIKRNGATLIGNYDKLNRNSTIEFKCNCGEIKNKIFYTIVQNNSAFCDKCTDKNRLIKLKQTYKIRREIEIEKEKQIIYVPRTKTEIKAYNKLIEKLKEHNSILIEKYNTINTESIIYFICGKCNESGNKAYRQLINISGAICHTCTQNNRMEKNKEILKKQGVENISQLKEVKEKKYKTALSHGFIITKEQWLLKIKDKGLDKYWEYLFDEIIGYDNLYQMRHLQCNTIWPKSPRSHLNQDEPNTNGQGCTICYQNSNRLKKEKFIEESILRFGKDRFTYESIPNIITNNHTLIKINCKNHGLFKTSYPTHLYGGGGCPSCTTKTESKLLEKIRINYPTIQHQFKTNWCKNKKTNRYLPFDFVIEEFKIIIELDGLQHFKQVSTWESPIQRNKRDIYKMKCANQNKYSIIRLLQEDVYYDKYDWLLELQSNIEKIVTEKKVQNIFISKNDEYNIFDNIDYNLVDDSDLSEEQEDIEENINTYN